MSSSYRAKTDGTRDSYGTVVRKKRRGTGSPRGVATKVTQEERVGWALTRVRSMRSRVAAHPEDRLLQLALAARLAEYEREKHTLAAITAPPPKTPRAARVRQ